MRTTKPSRLTEIVNIKDFGAVGDGFTKDTKAFRKAVASGRTVYFPPGTYLIDPLKVTDKVRLKKAGS